MALNYWPTLESLGVCENCTHKACEASRQMWRERDCRFCEQNIEPNELFYADDDRPGRYVHRKCLRIAWEG